MVIQYQNTIEEYVEASKTLAERKTKRRRANTWILTGIMVVYFSAATAFFEAVTPLNKTVIYFHLYSPVILAIAIVVAILCVMTLMAGKLPRISLRLAFKLVILIVIFSALFLMFRLLNSITPMPQRFVWSWTLFLPHTTWLFFTAWVTVLTVRQQRNKVKQMWNEQPSLARPKTVDIMAAGVVVSDAVSRTETHWDGFVGWKETKNLFVLFLSEHRILFFPKTAFASDEEREAMRALARFIPATASTAFPVIQPDSASSTPPPLPAQNLTGR
jgi:hypothetical protein